MITFLPLTSPIIVSTTSEGETYELVKENNKIIAKMMGNPREWYLTDVFSQGFHINGEDIGEPKEKKTDLTGLFNTV